MKALSLILIGLFLGGLLIVDSASSEAYPMMPVLMVHGLYGNKYNFSTLKIRLIKAGYPSSWLYAINLVPNDTMCDPSHVDQIHTAVEKIIMETGAAQVDLIGHSSGGLDNLNYMRYSSGRQYIRNWIALGSPLHINCRPSFQMPPEDMTPGDQTLYTSIYSTTDGVVPPSLSILDGARNIELSGISHGALLTNKEAFQYILQALHGAGLNDASAAPRLTQPSLLPLRWAQLKSAL